MKKDVVVFKGTKEGLIVLLDEQTLFEEVKHRLDDKLKSADNFLAGAQVIIDVGTRQLLSEELSELQNIIQSKGLFLRKVISQFVFTDDALPKDKRRSNEFRERTESKISFAQLADRINALEKNPDEASQVENTILIKRNLRSGQSIKYAGNVVVLGDINPGAEIIATGDIIIMGSLRGVAHAGASGDESSIVTAFRLQPTQLRIANHITRAPDGETLPPDYPELARIKDGVVVIESFLPEKQGKAYSF